LIKYLGDLFLKLCKWPRMRVAYGRDRRRGGRPHHRAHSSCFAEPNVARFLLGLRLFPLQFADALLKSGDPFLERRGFVGGFLDASTHAKKHSQCYGQNGGSKRKQGFFHGLTVLSERARSSSFQLGVLKAARPVDLSR